MSERILDFDYVRELVRQGGKRTAIKQWFVTNSSAIREEILGRVSQACSLEKRTDLVGQFAYFTELPTELENRDKFEGYLALSHIIHAGCAYQDQSCHAIIFGEDKPLILTGKTRSMISSLMSLSYPQINEMYTYLQSNLLQTNNPCYILRMRCLEQAAQEGVDIARFYYHQDGERTLMRNFFESTPTLEVSTHRNSFQMSANCLLLVLSSCARCDISADYFLLQDYSRFAYWDAERKLSKFEMDFLSAYLNATQEAQEAVVRYIGYCSLGLDIPINA